MIEVTVDAKDALNFFERYSKQAPAAISTAINRTVELANVAAAKVIRAGMTVRVPAFLLPPTQLPNEARATPSRLWAKADVGYGEDPGSIGERRRQILGKFETGGRKTAPDPNFPIAIPTKVIRPSRTDLVPRRLYPRNLVGQFDAFGKFQALGRGANIRTRFKKTGKGTLVIRKQVGRYFVAGSPGDKGYGVYERTGSGKTDVRMLWAFRQAIPIPASLHYTETITRVVDERFSAELDAVFDFMTVRT